MDTDTATLTDPQIGQIFWNMAMTEAMVLAMLFDSEAKGPVRPVQMVILAFISAGICIGIGLLSRSIFRWGNRGRRRAHTSPTSPPYLPYISSISPLNLPYTSPIPPLHRSASS